jgi:hypothetical protein
METVPCVQLSTHVAPVISFLERRLGEISTISTLVSVSMDAQETTIVTELEDVPNAHADAPLVTAKLFVLHALMDFSPKKTPV